MVLILAASIMIASVFCLITVLLSVRYIKKTYDSIDNVLDSVLTRNKLFPMEETKDSRLSKLTHKAAKIMQMNTCDAAKSRQEKEIIQSFLSDMSHQMKTPLSGVSMYTDLLLEGKVTALEQQEFLTRIKAGTDKLQWMMDSLLKMSRLEIGAIELSPVPGGIRKTVADSINSVMGLADSKNISISTSAFQEITLLHDRKWTCEALTNILENAVKYSPPQGEISITVETLPIYSKICVTDHGIGIEPQEWNYVFKRFFRGNNAKGEKGAGLGLYLASLILEKQGGYILVDSIPGQYTTFSMFLLNCKK